jgi:hypothetical protein
MNISRVRGLAAAGLFALLATGCAVGVEGGGGGVGVGVDVGPDYYQPCCYGGWYGGGWDAGYAVAPYRGGDHRFDHAGGRGGGGAPATHAFRAAPASRPMPSIPSGPRGGGGARGGGGRH